MLRCSVSRRIVGGFAALSLAAALAPSVAFADEFSDEAPEGLVDSVADQIMEQLDDVDDFAVIQTANVDDDLLECLSASLPTKFDLRKASAAKDADGYFETGDTNYVTSVKRQNPWGTCWAFASIAACESSLLSSSERAVDGDDPINLSEKHLAWFSYAQIPEGDDSGQGGEGAYLADDSYEGRYDLGGSASLAIGSLGSGAGPVSESSDPSFVYGTSKEDDWSISSELRFKSDYNLKDGNELPSPNTTDEQGGYVYDENATTAIKSEVLKGRAVAMAFCADDSRPSQDRSNYIYINPETWSHYCYEQVDVNHMVTVVGWDDDYPKENFLTRAAVVDENGERIYEGDDTPVVRDVDQPPADGAWICKNSWGSTSWGYEGYFYLSYYDQSIAAPQSYELEEVLSVDESDNRIIDQYDFMDKNWTYSVDLDQEVCTANVFTAKTDETLVAASCTTASVGVTATYRIYRLSSNYETPTDGILVGEFTETYEYAGYHRMNFEDAGCAGMGLKEGVTYSIVVTQVAASGFPTMVIPVGANERYAEAYEEENGFPYSQWSKGVVNEGESFIEKNGVWCDWTVFSSGLLAELENGEQYDFDNPSIKGYAVAGVDEAFNIANASISVSEAGLIYNGEEQVPSVASVTFDNRELQAGADYEVFVNAQTNVGSYLLTVVGKGDFYGEQEVSWEILPREAGIEWSSKTLVYNGKAQALEATVTNVVAGDKVSAKVEGSQINAGSGYTAVVTGLDDSNYALSQEYSKTFSIARASQTVKVGKTSASKALAAAKSGTYKGKLAKAWTANAKTGYKFSAKTTLSFAKSGVKVYSASKKKWVSVSATGKYGKYFTVTSGGKVTVKAGLPKGSYKLYIKGSAKAAGNYKAASNTVSLVVKVK